ncbi:Pimeloyl-ACP methyl ester carboxylesterase [Streptomyces sp. DvalAA-14]|uniref:alpha/beta fold hydrolase n=1 Tax=unclassified Streptomyces TaxID=2593676 RepID=UPI00081BA291|nr:MULTISPECIES: alpha/beta hydrolase [unclassified Streptomyces]MYS24454.1 alpha/beta fold hydrolase [Streptomyces sp. SID4948]SCE46182.1 Pimeloyl-ACP methyl ester carboxylesterase [Streptomyces sp. DvalAA-14]
MSRPSALDLPENVSARRLETSRGSFAVLDAAPAQHAPPLGTALLVPGFTGSKEDFLDLLPPLTDGGYRIVAVDGRGQHESDGPRDEAAYAQAELAADVIAQSAALAGGPLHLLGHSLGGHIARAAVLAAGPSAWASLTLMSSGPGRIAPSQQVRTQLLVDHLPNMDMETAWLSMRAMDAESATASVTADATPTADADAGEDTPPWLEEFLHRRWVTTSPEQLIATAKQLMTEPDRVAELAAVRLPKLVLSGEVDYAWPVPSMDAMAERLNAERVVVKGAEHSPNAERPEQTAAALLAFWGRSLTGK